MCGLAGYFSRSGLSDSDAKSIAVEMADRLIHRGPDDAGVWIDEEAGIAIAHRRLSVLDLSPAGKQPMISAFGRYVFAFNGEIYNHLQLRKDLARLDGFTVWRGSSDTETLLAAFESWGIEATLKKTIGMFAITLWDRKERTLTLARDRMGEKPLYYGWQGSSFLFGSELKALHAHPEFEADLDRRVLAMYMRRGYIEAPFSIYKRVFKLLPGSYLQIGERDDPGTLPEPIRYWSLRAAAKRGAVQPFSGSDVEAVGELESRLKEAIALQRVADVPLGAFLSGGVDSSTVVALMQEQAAHPVKSFTIGFDEHAYNEAAHAKRVARHLGTDHTELYVTSREAMETIPKLPLLYDEPFGDSSAIPTYMVSRLARQHVTVSLSGDGGDELFCGYTRYRRAKDIWNAIRRFPGGVRDVLALGVNTCSRLGGDSEIAQRMERLALYLSSRNIGECFQGYVLQRQDTQDLVLGSGQPPPSTDAPVFEDSDKNDWNEMLYADATSYLPDDILAKVDRASMAVSLESRVPMLDHRVVEFAWTLPAHLKMRGDEGKWILKQVLRKYVPDELIDRPKMGFGVPVGQWIRGPLRDWAENLLSEDHLDQQGYLNSRLVRREWSRHLNGSSGGGDRIWQVLMFQAWLESIDQAQSVQGQSIDDNTTMNVCTA